MIVSTNDVMDGIVKCNTEMEGLEKRMFVFLAGPHMVLSVVSSEGNRT